MARHQWSPELGGPLPQECLAKQKCTKCRLTRYTYKFGPWKSYEYKMGRKYVDGVGPLMAGTPPCEPREDSTK